MIKSLNYVVEVFGLYVLGFGEGTRFRDHCIILYYELVYNGKDGFVCLPNTVIARSLFVSLLNIYFKGKRPSFQYMANQGRTLRGG